MIAPLRTRPAVLQPSIEFRPFSIGAMFRVVTRRYFYRNNMFPLERSTDRYEGR